MNSQSNHRVALPNPDLVKHLILSDPNAIKVCKEYLSNGQWILSDAFNKNVAVRHLIYARSATIDTLLKELWKAFKIDSSHAALIAVGGYGRQELHPCSDIDLLFLVNSKNMDKTFENIQPLITFLWDIGLQIGHSVRTVKECIDNAKDDITIATNLMESRILCGSADLFEEIKIGTGPKIMWPARSFYEAKVAEQKARYRKYKGSSFDLEPNLKGSPGGLRDIQLVGWIAKRYFDSESLHDLANQGVFTLQEYRTLVGCQFFLWRVRFALHLITGRGEDRLLFQHQKRVAEFLGFSDTKEAMGVEQLMKKYFRAAIKVRNVTELLLQVFEEVILEDDNKKNIQPIDEYFQLENDRIALIDPDIVSRQPSLLLKTFITAARVPGNKHVSAQTLRAIRNNRHLIDHNYRNNPEHCRLFLEFFSIKHQGDRPLFLMKRNGILAHFIPQFERISGQMQFDMFHTYTVDEHTLFLLKNLSRFASPEFEQEFPYCSKIMRKIEKPQIIFLAGLFHDIAKGRGGDHSELGAKDALRFCLHLQMPTTDAELVSWLVQFHLVMSITAQRKDISDIDVIANFANQVGSQQKLDLLYLLTVADIRATSPKLWNSWKDALLRELYLATSDFLKQGKDQALSMDSQIPSIKEQALELLKERKISPTDTLNLWQSLDDDYFVSTPLDRIVWHVECILKHGHGHGPLVEIKRHYNQGGTEIFIYIPDQADLFAAITASLTQKSLSIQTAELYTTTNDLCLDTFVVLEEDGKPIQSSNRILSIKKLLKKNLRHISGISKQVKKHVSSRLRQFDVPTEVKFIQSELTRYSQIELTALDQPGLLARVGEAFKECEVIIHSARISTLGEKVEDTFIVSDREENPILDTQLQERIRSAIRSHLN